MGLDFHREYRQCQTIRCLYNSWLVRRIIAIIPSVSLKPASINFCLTGIFIWTWLLFTGFLNFISFFSSWYSNFNFRTQVSSPFFSIFFPLRDEFVFFVFFSGREVISYSAGRVKVNVLPFPTSDSTQIFPP